MREPVAKEPGRAGRGILPTSKVMGRTRHHHMTSTLPSSTSPVLRCAAAWWHSNSLAEERAHVQGRLDNCKIESGLLPKFRVTPMVCAWEAVAKDPDRGWVRGERNLGESTTGPGTTHFPPLYMCPTTMTRERSGQLIDLWH